MNYIELSIENVEEKTYELYERIKNNYQYDLVVFIAKGSYLIGKKLAEIKQVPLLEIHATRKGGSFKKLIKPIVGLLPNKILIKLREIEFLSDYHKKNKERKIHFEKNIYNKYKDSKKILLVDDSIDFGNSVIGTKTALEVFFQEAEIKVAVFNVMKKSAIRPDFCLFEDKMLNGPWSIDSKENATHIKLYKNWKKNQNQK